MIYHCSSIPVYLTHKSACDFIVVDHNRYTYNAVKKYVQWIYLPTSLPIIKHIPNHCNTPPPLRFLGLFSVLENIHYFKPLRMGSNPAGLYFYGI